MKKLLSTVMILTLMFTFVQTAKFLLFIIPQQAVQKLLHKQLQIPQMQTFLKSLRLNHIQAMTSTGLMITAV